MILALIGCGGKAVIAPETLDSLCKDAYGGFEDPDALAATTESLRGWLDGHDEPEGWALTELAEEHVAGVDRPDRPLADADGAAGQAVSPFSLESHVALVLLADQSVVGSNYEQFDRTFTEGGDYFGDHGCDVARSWNDIVKVTLGVKLPYAYGKDYRWVGDDAVIARGWVGDEAFSEDGSVAIHQSFTLDVFLREGQGVRRLQAQWAELDLGAAEALGEETKLNLSIDGLLEVFEDTDKALGELGL